MQHDHVSKKMNFELLTLFPGSGGVCGQYICYHAAAFDDSYKFDLQHDHVLKKLNFDLLTLSLVSRGAGSECKIFATLLLHFVIPLNLICNMTMF